MSASDFSRFVPREHLQRSLENATGRADVQIVGEAKVERATAGVEGFTSLVLRIRVSYRFPGDDTSSYAKVFVVKRMPEVESQLELIRSCRVFLREGLYFDKVVPLLRRASAGEVDVPIPECYYAVYDGNGDAIYMEDLSEGGFRTPDHMYRGEGLDLAHCSVAMKKLGRLHGLSVAAERVLPPESGGWLKMIPELAKDSMFFELAPDEPPMPLLGMINKGLETLSNISKNIEGLPKEAEASGMLTKVIQGTWLTLTKLVKPNRKGRNLLTHGDCWMNNMMFRYERDSSGAERPINVKFIDLQLARYCHPSLDLLYFMYLGTTKSFRDKYFDRLIVEYYDSMVETLKILNAGSPPLSLDEFVADLHGEYKPFGVIIGAVFTPILRLGEDLVPSNADEMTPEKFKEFFETGNASLIRKRFANDPDYRSKIEDAVREFVDMAFPHGLNSLKLSPLLI